MPEPLGGTSPEGSVNGQGAGVSPAPGGSASPSSGVAASGTQTPPQPIAGAGTSSPGALAPGGASSSGQPPPAPSGTPPPALSAFRQLAAQHAPDLSQQHADDQALFQSLLQTRQQAQQAAPYLSQMLPHWPAFQGWLAEQQRSKQQTQQPSGEKPWWSQWWSPPEYDPSWEQMLTRDAQGNVVPVQGAPPDLPGKYQQYQHFRRGQLDKLLQNPFTYFEEPVKHLAQQMADQAVRQHLGSYQDTQFATNFVSQNAAWLHQRDAQGNSVQETVFDPQNGKWVSRPALSAAGQAFQNYVHEAASLGLTDVRAQQRYAVSMVQRDTALAGSQQAQGAQQQNQAARQQFLNTAAAGGVHMPNVGGSLSSPNLNGNAPPQNPSLDLAEMLRRGLSAGGVTDRDLMAVR